MTPPKEEEKKSSLILEDRYKPYLNPFRRRDLKNKPYRSYSTEGFWV